MRAVKMSFSGAPHMVFWWPPNEKVAEQFLTGNDPRMARLSVRYDNGQLCVFKRKEPRP